MTMSNFRIELVCMHDKPCAHGERCKKTTFLETKCPDCDEPYRIDEHHQDFAFVREALERGDRSVLSCYHKWLRPKQAAN